MERICEIFPNVEEIEVDYKRDYKFPEMDLSDEKFVKATYKDSFACNFRIECRNDDCTQKYFDLYSVISSMVAHKESEKEYVMNCTGKESKKHNHSCPCKLEFRIRISYK